MGDYTRVGPQCATTPAGCPACALGGGGRCLAAVVPADRGEGAAPQILVFAAASVAAAVPRDRLASAGADGPEQPCPAAATAFSGHAADPAAAPVAADPPAPGASRSRRRDGGRGSRGLDRPCAIDHNAEPTIARVRDGGRAGEGEIHSDTEEPPCPALNGMGGSTDQGSMLTRHRRAVQERNSRAAPFGFRRFRAAYTDPPFGARARGVAFRFCGKGSVMV